MRFYADFYLDSYSVSYGESALGNWDVSDSFTFSTQLNGGFSNASMNINMPRLYGSLFARQTLGTIVTVFDGQGRYVYNGRVSKCQNTSNGVQVEATGVFDDGARVNVPTALWLDPATTTGDVIRDCCALVSSWHGPTDLHTSGPDVPVGVQDYDDEVKVNDMITKMLKLGYRTTNIWPYYFVIYNNQIPSIVVEKPTQYLNWLIPIKESAGVSVSIDNVFNKIFILYDDTADDAVGPTLYPTPAEDLGSQARYGVREGVLNVGEFGLTIGQDLQAIALQKYTRPKSVIPMKVQGYVTSAAGHTEPSYMVRAGDILGVRENDEHAVIDQLNTSNNTGGFVTGTSFSSSSMESTYTLATSDRRLDYLLARLGLSGGLS